MNKPYILAVDQGTSGMKLLLWDTRTGERFTAGRDYPTQSPAPGWGEQNPDDWWQALCAGVPEVLQKAGVSAEAIAAIGVDGISWTPVMLDEAGRVLAPAPIWYDTRAQEECQEIHRRVGEGAFACSGNPVQPYYTLPKVMWFEKHRPEVAAQIRHVLGSNGYLVYKLTGIFSQDHSQAYGWACYNMADGLWDEAMARQLGIDPGWLPPLYESSAIVGEVTAEAAALCGLCAGIPVIAGGLDAACGALGAGVINPGPVHEQSGSAGGMSICTDRYQPARGLIVSRHVAPGRWLVQGGTVGGGGLVNWLCREMYPDADKTEKKERRNELTQAAAAVPAGSEGLIFLPYMAGERSPIWNPQAKGVFFGLDFAKGRGHMARAVMEGAALALRHNIERAPETEKKEMRAVGGASANALWMQIKADVTGCPIRAVADPDATSLGCAMLAGLGCGLFENLDQACARFVELAETAYTPNPAHKAIYDKRFEQYKHLYNTLEGTMKGWDE